MDEEQHWPTAGSSGVEFESEPLSPPPGLTRSRADRAARRGHVLVGLVLTVGEFAG